MPAYVTCPHCEHTMVVTQLCSRRCRLCRQCSGGYIVSGTRPVAMPLPVHTAAGLLAWLRAREARALATR